MFAAIWADDGRRVISVIRHPLPLLALAVLFCTRRLRVLVRLPGRSEITG